MEMENGQNNAYGGHLGLTSQTTVLISSDGHGVFPANIYTSVNVTRNPELREALYSGKLHHVPCPFTGCLYRLAVPLRYHDEELRLFVLVIPEGLRHEEFKQRSELLGELARERDVLPSYVSNFETVFSFEALAALERSRRDALAARAKGATSAPKTGAAADDFANEATVMRTLPGPASLSSGEGDLQQRQRELDLLLAEEQQALEAQKQAIEDERRQLETRRQQLEDVSSRLERESARTDEVLAQLAADRADIERWRTSLEEQRQALEAQKQAFEDERRALEVERLNFEQLRLRAEQNAPAAASDEATQVVTDDQFIEIVGGLDAEADDDDAPFVPAAEPGFEGEVLDDGASPATGRPASSEATQVIANLDDYMIDDDDIDGIDALDADAAGARDEVAFAALEAGAVPAAFDTAAADGRSFHVASGPTQVLASHRLPNGRLQAFERGRPDLFVQYHEIEDVPVAGLLLAALDEGGDVDDWVVWAFDVTKPADSRVLERIAAEERVRLALYRDDATLAKAWEVTLPLGANIAHILERARNAAARNPYDADAFARAAGRYRAETYERLGTMRHPFRRTSFDDVATASQARLASSITGYWSQGDVLEYLIANRSFPLDQFRAIQRRVVTAALEWGIALNTALLDVAVDAGFAADHRALVERLLANFAEVCVGIRPNDLDPLEQWENWDALFELAQQTGVGPDPDVLELAEASLKRAREFQESLDAGNDEYLDGVEQVIELDDDDDLIEESSDAYELEELATMSRQDLEGLLASEAGRLDAAHMLIERFGVDALDAVLDASERMGVDELATLEVAFEANAAALEDALVGRLAGRGPCATRIAACALVSRGNTDAIPLLLEALRDDARNGDPDAFARLLADYGAPLVAPLTRELKRHDGNEHLVRLLAHLERTCPGTIGEFARDRSKPLREAARRARTRLQQ